MPARVLSCSAENGQDRADQAWLVFPNGYAFEAAPGSPDAMFDVGLPPAART